MECKRRSDDIQITESCAFTERLCAASTYLDHIKQSTSLSDDDKKQLIVEFNEDLYRSVLDDVTHFVKEHEGDIKRVHSEWTELYGFAKCSVSECVQTERHYGGGRRYRKRERESEEEDALYAFYESLYDRVHHYIFHLYDVGLRADAASLSLSQQRDDEKEPQNEEVTVDEVFAVE